MSSVKRAGPSLRGGWTCKVAGQPRAGFLSVQRPPHLGSQPRLCQPCKQAQVAKQLSLHFNFKCSNHKNLEGCENEQINNTPAPLKWKMCVLTF